jgi:AraC-like DNA-binding protein
VSRKKTTREEIHSWRQRSLDVQTSQVVAGRAPGPVPPRGWAAPLRRLIEESLAPQEGPSWWTPMNAYFGSVETRTDPSSYYWDGMKRIGRHDQPLVFFQFTFAGMGHFEQYGHPPERILPGTGFVAVIPSRHRYYLPKESPGWTFAWIGIYHPYLVRRISKQVKTAGPILRATPKSPLVTRFLRLVRGAFRKDFGDRFKVERELFDFTLAFEHHSEQARSHPEGDALLAEVRQRVLASPRQRIDVETLATERRMSRSAYSHFFRARTGLTPAHFMTEVRVQEAARLLESTNLDLASIAEECGFANGNHFGKVFRRFRRQGTGAYRRSIR